MWVGCDNFAESPNCRERLALPEMWPPEVGSKDEARGCIECGSGTDQEGPRIYPAAPRELASPKDRDAVICIVGDGQIAQIIKTDSLRVRDGDAHPGRQRGEL